ncbi:MAG: SH3 domain-containing protein [Anaerolineales bacterium]|nr:SH3 domain-containing protein [Anaerolineales bacterium]
MKAKITTILCMPVLLLSACRMGISAEGLPTGTPAPIITAALPASATPFVIDTPQTLPAAPTAQPLLGATTTRINIRSTPNTAGDIIGVLESGQTVEITGKDPSETWLQIIHNPAPGGKGWITREFTQVESQLDVPVIGASGIMLEGTSLPSGSQTAVLLETVHVRSGPGTEYGSLGMLTSQDVVILTGRTESGSWFQIEYPGGPDGKGWLAAGYVDTGPVNSLAITDNSGQLLGTQTPTGVPPTPVPPVITAAADEDTAQSPAVRITLSSAASRAFSFSNDLSSPNGDRKDWLEFKVDQFPKGEPVTLLVSLECGWDGSLATELRLDGQLLENWSSIRCSTEKRPLNVLSGSSYLLQLEIASPGSNLQYIYYTIRFNMP